MDKIRVFYMVYGLTSGGIEKYSISLYKHIDKEIIVMDFITKLDREEFFDRALYDLGGKKIPLSRNCHGNKLSKMIQYLKNVNKVIDTGYDVAYFNLSTPAAVFKYPLICKLHGIKNIIIHSHNSSEANGKMANKFLNALGRRYINHIAKEKFACSDKAAVWMYGKQAVEKKSYTFIKNGLEIDKYTFNQSVREKLRKQYNFDKEALVIGHIGRFEKQKNHEFLIDIFAEVSRTRSNAYLVLIGVGSLEQSMEEKVKKYQLEDKVLFLGEISNVNEYLQMIDIFVLPSLFEGLPIVGIEAQAAGLKCFFSSTISREADITGNVLFVDLEAGAEGWANVILQHADYSRGSQKQAIREAGYDINFTSALVQERIEKMVEDDVIAR